MWHLLLVSAWKSRSHTPPPAARNAIRTPPPAGELLRPGSRQERYPQPVPARPSPQIVAAVPSSSHKSPAATLCLSADRLLRQDESPSPISISPHGFHLWRPLMISLSSIGEAQQGLLVREMTEQPKEKTANTAAATLNDDLIVDILSRLPVKSLCRCKCVSPQWRDLISHPDHRHRFSQTLAGFFRNGFNNGREVWQFTNLGEPRQPPLISTPFAFMPGYEDVTIVDACNGLLLCRPPKGSPHHLSRYVVCNPANKSWVVLPDSGSHGDDVEDDEPFVARLGFDPAASQHFYVFEIVDNNYGTVAGVEIYSSQTGAWSYKESQWNYETHLFKNSPSVFLNGLLHLSTIQFEVVAVDVDGESWWVLPVPEDPDHVDDRANWDPGYLGQ